MSCRKLTVRDLPHRLLVPGDNRRVLTTTLTAGRLPNREQTVFSPVAGLQTAPVFYICFVLTVSEKSIILIPFAVR